MSNDDEPLITAEEHPFDTGFYWRCASCGATAGSTNDLFPQRSGAVTLGKLLHRCAPTGTQGTEHKS